MVNAIFDFSQPEICSAWIGAIGGVVTALLATVAASGITWRINKRKELEAQLAECQGDVEYLLEVEKRLGEVLKAMNGASFKLRVRKDVLRSGLVWSGRFTPGRIRREKSR